MNRVLLDIDPAHPETSNRKTLLASTNNQVISQDINIADAGSYLIGFVQCTVACTLRILQGPRPGLYPWKQEISVGASSGIPAGGATGLEVDSLPIRRRGQVMKVEVDVAGGSGTNEFRVYVAGAD